MVVVEQSGTRILKRVRMEDVNPPVPAATSIMRSGTSLRPFTGRNPETRNTVSKCVSDTAAIGEQTSCLLLQAQGRIDAGDIGAGADFYRYIASAAEFSPEERLAGARKLYELGEQSGDDALREEALLGLLDAELIAGREARSARRTLVAMALERKDRPLAIERLDDVVANDPTDARSLANLAVLMRQEGREGAEERMARAIALLQDTGGTVPKGWTDFLKFGG